MEKENKDILVDRRNGSTRLVQKHLLVQSFQRCPLLHSTLELERNDIDLTLHVGPSYEHDQCDSLNSENDILHFWTELTEHAFVWICTLLLRGVGRVHHAR